MGFSAKNELDNKLS